MENSEKIAEYTKLLERVYLDNNVSPEERAELRAKAAALGLDLDTMHHIEENFIRNTGAIDVTNYDEYTENSYNFQPENWDQQYNSYASPEEVDYSAAIDDPNKGSKIERFFKNALSCKSVSEYEDFYKNNYSFIKGKIDRKKNNNIVLYKKNSSEPETEADFDDPVRIAELYTYANVNNIDLFIPDIDDIRNFGLGEIKTAYNNFVKTRDINVQKSKVEDFKREFNIAESVENKISIIDNDLTWADFMTPDKNGNLFTVGKVIPAFAWGINEVLSGYKIQEIKNDSSHTIVIGKLNTKTGKYDTRNMSSESFLSLIKSREKYLEDKKNAENGYELQKTKEQFENEIGVIELVPRLNTADNFAHNFKIMCQENCNNHQEALEFANHLFNTMTSEEKKSFIKMKESYEILNKVPFEEYICSMYDAATHDFLQLNTIEKGTLIDTYQNNRNLEKSPGTKLPDYELKIGEKINMNLHFSTNVFGSSKSIETKPQSFELKVYDPINRMITILSEDKKSAYTIQYDKFAEQAVEIKKQQFKEVSKVKQCKSHKDYCISIS